MSPRIPAAAIWSADGVLHHAVFAIDIIGFGRYDPALHTYLRAALYGIIADSLAQVGTPLQSCYHEDRGDAVLVITPAGSSVEPLLGQWIHQLRAALRQHNRISAATAQLRLRAAIHAGFVTADPYGVGGRAVLHLCRLLDAPAFKDVLEDTSAELGLIVSDFLYQEVVRDARGLIDPTTYAAISIDVKETRGRAWLCVPPPPPATTRPSSAPASVCAPSQTLTVRGFHRRDLHRGTGHRR